MDRTKHQARGFTLITTLLLLLLLSGIAIGMLMMVRTEGSVGTQDLENDMTYHAAEGAIEKQTSDLANTFQNIEAPTVANIEALSALTPPVNQYNGITYPVYTLTPATTPSGALASNFGEIASGPNQGLYAQLIPIALQATAQGPLGDEVNMTRTVEMALIPVFQFGVFSNSDLGFYSSPNLNFAGRVHTNGDLYLGVADCCTLTFHDKLTAYGNVIRTVLPNGLTATSYNDNGTVLIPYESSGCDGTQPYCRAMSNGSDRWGSVTGAGGNPPASGPNSSWQNTSLTQYNSLLIDGDYGNTKYGTGAVNLSLPFVNGTNGTNTGPQPYEILRQPPAGESPTSSLGGSRLYNEASIRVLFADDPNDLPCGNPSTPPAGCGAGDAQNVRLANWKNPSSALDYSHGVPTSTPGGLKALAGGDSYTTYFATATTAIPNPATWVKTLPSPFQLPSDWLYSPLYPFPANTQTINDLGAGIAPYMVADPNGNGINVEPWPTVQTCTPNVPVVSPPASGPPDCTTNVTYPYIVWPTGSKGTNTWPNVPDQGASTWNLIDGYLRVEYRDVNGAYHPVTQEWLGLGFARGPVPPAAPGANAINPNAILLLQETADRNNDNAFDSVGVAPTFSSACTKVSGGKCVQTTYTPYPGKPPEVPVDSVTTYSWWGDSALPAGQQSATQFNYYPINFYDPREGEPRDAITGDNSCTPNGVMNAVEVDTGNLKQWLAGKIGASGSKVDYLSQNGYLLYFSDRRGMLKNPNGTQVDPPNTKTGDSGLEDTINSSSAPGNTDGKLDPIPAGKNFSPEDTNLNGVLDNWGAVNLGLGLGYSPLPASGAGVGYTAKNQMNKIVNASAIPNPYAVGNRIPQCSIAQKNWVSGARHALKLVDGSLGNVPLRPDNSKGGFTVGSENPVYIFGDFNSNAGDPAWSGKADPAGMAAAGVVADAVTVLSNAWSDKTSYLGQGPTQPTLRQATINTYYRLAVAGGKSVNFPFPSWETSTDYGFGTDGGVHNFLRFIEDWQDPGTTLNYMGSLVSLYYSTYATGTFKCCAYSVYQPPIRNYIFDPDFTQPQDLPPATPMFRDVDNLSFRQTFTPCTVQSNGVCSN